MALETVTHAIAKTLLPVRNLFGAIACSALALMMFLTFVDVGMRYIFNSPIPGGLELVEYMMALIVPFALTVTAFEKAHIGVDLIMERFPRKFQAAVACVTHLICLCLYLLITWQSYLNIGEQYHSEMTSAVLLIPVYPFVAALTAAFALLSLITFLQLLEKLSKVVSQWTHS